MIAAYKLTIVGCLAPVLVLTGCTTAAPRTAPAEPATAPVASAEASRLPPPAVAAALLPAIGGGLPPAAESSEPHFDVKVRNARAKDFFIGLVEGTPYNVIVHPDVAGRIDLDLKNVTVPEVMTVVRDAFGYDFDAIGKTYKVFPNAVRTRLFHVDYLAMKRIGKSDITTTAGGVSETTSSGDQAGSGTSTTRSAVSSQVTTESEADFWAELRASVQAVVGTGEGRLVTANPQVGLLMVKARPDELRDVERFLSASLRSAQRQVVLEARILEVELSDGFQSGINWAEIRNSHGDSALFGFGATNTAQADNVAQAFNTGGAIARQTASQLTSSVSRTFALGLYAHDFTALIDLLKTQGDVQVLSSPRVATVNNQKAVIKVGSDEFFVTDVESNTTTGAATTSTASVELTPFFSGVVLDVIPQISPDGSVILHIHPTVSQVTEQTKLINTSFGSLSLPLAASTVRESDTVIRAQDGQVVVIGGLMQTTKRKQTTKVPLLGDVPLLGQLFSHTSDTERKTELVILLKPTVVESASDWAQQINRSSPRVNEMRGGF